VKVGGSLLAYDRLAIAWRTWITLQPQMATIVIVGGGTHVDHVQQQAKAQPVDESTLHWQCIKAMSESARAFAAITGTDVWEGPDLARLSALDNDHWAGVIYDPAAWLKSDEPNCEGLRLPQTSEVSSDSIAARIAHCLDAHELVLLKSTAAPEPTRLTYWASAGFVDRWFSKAVEMLPCIRVVNLRDDRAFATVIQKPRIQKK
jgi:aspartokinase-like uncharacterized kinase